MTTTIIINDAPYGTEKAYNALRLAAALLQREDEQHVRVFFMADAVTGALPNQNTPNGYYNIERMIKGLVGKGVPIRLCGSCMDARGIASLPLIESTARSTMAELADWVATSDQTLTF
jgi:uncharacterized protein involved in oxidation of intracellular sulfur